MDTLALTLWLSLLMGTLYVTLITRVILIRRSQRIGFGDGGDRRLRGALRAQVNAGEQTPIFLILFALSEVSLGTYLWIGALAVLFSTGRLIHAWGMSRQRHRLRVLGTALNLSAYLLVLLTLAWALI